MTSECAIAGLYTFDSSALNCYACSLRFLFQSLGAVALCASLANLPNAHALYFP
jgi:hypothetical protein